MLPSSRSDRIEFCNGRGLDSSSEPISIHPKNQEGMIEFGLSIPGGIFYAGYRHIWE